MVYHSLTTFRGKTTCSSSIGDLPKNVNALIVSFGWRQGCHLAKESKGQLDEHMAVNADSVPLNCGAFWASGEDVFSSPFL